MNSDILGFCDWICQDINRSLLVESKTKTSRNMRNFSCPAVDKIIFNGDMTIVFFIDGTKSTVKKDAMDAYDRKTAVVYAIIKRLFATNFVKGTANSNYIGVVNKLIKNKSFDKEESERIRARQAAEARERHIAEQKKLAEKAFKRRVKNRIREIEVEEAAKASLEAKKNASGQKTSKISKILTESKNAKPDPTYQKPRKPFSQFSQEEKRAYWRAQNAKRRALRK